MEDLEPGISLWDLLKKMVIEIRDLTERNKILQEQNKSLLAQVEIKFK